MGICSWIPHIYQESHSLLRDMDKGKYVNREYEYAPFFLIFVSSLHFIWL